MGSLRVLIAGEALEARVENPLMSLVERGASQSEGYNGCLP